MPERPDRPARLVAVVRGRVQGVGFRIFVRGHAEQLELLGWVANRADGSVECVAEGDRAALERLLANLQIGPPGARVDRVVVAWEPPTGTLDPFAVRASGHPGD